MCAERAALLAPAGLLVLLEGTGPRRLLDLIFGLTPGWWKFADTDLRPDYPLLAPARWLQLFREEGFVETAGMPAVDAELPDPDQMVLLARAATPVASAAQERTPADHSNGTAPHRNGTASNSKPATWILVDPPADIVDELSQRLRTCGNEVIAVESNAALPTLASERPAGSLRVVDFDRLNAAPANLDGPEALVRRLRRCSDRQH